MPAAHVESLRSIVLLGHGGAGKTSLAEALLHAAGAIPTKGSVERGTTVCDFDPQAKEAGHSLATSVVHFGHDGVEVELLDTPGYPDFAGHAIAAMDGADTAVVVVNAQGGIELSTERMMRAAAARGLSRMLVVNKIDAPDVDLPRLVAELRERFGPACRVLDLPEKNRNGVVDVLEHAEGDADFDSVAAAHRALVDQLVEEDDALLERFLGDGQDPSPTELHRPFERALREGRLVPILFTSARTGAGVRELLHVVHTLAPNPSEANPPRFHRGLPGQSSTTLSAVPDPERHVLAHVFKVVIDPYMGKVAVFRVHQGTIRRDAQLFVGAGRKPIRAAHLYRLHGKDYTEVDALGPGQVGAIARVEELGLQDVLHDSHDEDDVWLEPMDLPRPMQGVAVVAKRQVDDQRLLDVLGRMTQEDPCLLVERAPNGRETVIRALGEVHLRRTLERMASRHKLDVSTHPPRVAYRETITGRAEGHHRHKKQSGGAGQFGEVRLRVEPLARGAGFEFVDAVRGGAIPNVFIPAVEKGVLRALSEGVLAGYPVDDVRVTVLDGKTHAVDGKEVAFATAARKATIQAVLAAAPIVLEPIVSIEVVTPPGALGEVTADLASRRGHVHGTAPSGVDLVSIRGEVPLAETNEYVSRLRSITGGRGSYQLDFSRHAQVPPAVQARLVAAHERHEDDD